MSQDMTALATRFSVNGQNVEAFPGPGERLSETLRESLGTRDVKIGCNAGDCGACTVLLDGLPVCACLTPTQQVEQRKIETLAGLFENDPIAKNLGERFQDHGAAQCGICTPGMMVSAVALLRENAAPTEGEVRDALGGVLCRCTGYRKIIDAVMARPAPERIDSGLEHSTGFRGQAKGEQQRKTDSTPIDNAPATALEGNVGQSIRRVDGAEKVSGIEQFSDDLADADTLEILVIRSPFPRAGFVLGDLEGFVRARPGLEAFLTVKDIQGRNEFGVIPPFADQPVFAETETRFRGEAVAAIIGAPEAIRHLDPNELPVTWTELTAAQDVKSAQMPGASALHKGRDQNVMCGGFVQCGEAKSALKKATVTVEGHFSSGFVEHAYIEPEAGFARMAGEQVEIYAGTQAPVMDLESLEIILGCARSKIRIIPTGIGGGFGSKLDLSVQPYLALAAIKTGKPVRLTYSRTESMQSTTKRHPSDIRLKIGADTAGKICGFDFYGEFDTGAYASWGPTVATRVPVHASGPYQISDYRAESKGIHTNNPPAGAFRGFGVPQAAIAQESLFDELAAKLGQDALEFRINNALSAGAQTVCGQVFSQGVGIRACLESLRPAWRTEKANAEGFNRANDVLKRGVGIAAGWYGCGNTSLPNPSTIKSGIRSDGTIVLHQGAVDIGQGANTVIAQIFATALGVATEKIERVGPDTDRTPDAGKTSASRQTYVSGAAAHRSGTALRASILERLNVGDDAVLSFGDGFVTATDIGVEHRLDLSTLASCPEGYVFGAEETYDPPTKPLDANGQGAPYAQFGYAAHLVVVEVDTRLGTVAAQKFVAAHDVGKAINPMLVEGQVHGGIAQGIGMALMEEYIPGRTENLHDYLIPTIGDVPPIETIIIEDADEHGPHGAKGLGEHVLIPTAPAILNAIHAAVGVRITEVPATPSRVSAAIKARSNE